MKYNWSYLLKVEDIVKKDKNIEIILDELLKKFEYKWCFDNKITASFNEKFYNIIFTRDDTTTYITLNSANNKNLVLNYEIKILLQPRDKINVTINATKVKTDEDIITKRSDNFKYKSDLVNNISSSVIDTSIWSHRYSLKEETYIIPDLRCRTYIRRNDDMYAEKNIKYLGNVGIDGGFTTYKSKLPISFLLQRSHEKFLADFEEDYRKPHVYTKKNKIGF